MIDVVIENGAVVPVSVEAADWMQRYSHLEEGEMVSWLLEEGFEVISTC